MATRKTPPLRRITRRELLNGMALGVGASLWGDARARSCPVVKARGEPVVQDDFVPEQAPGYYPPGRTGIRGDHEGSFNFAHELRKGTEWSALGQASSTGERYDLVVVGGGISGLSAAHFYRKRLGPEARVLILENHDDFGGHATRNEFTLDGRLLITYGGSQSIASPSTFSDVSKRLMQDLGIDLAVFEDAYDHQLYSRFGTGLFFDRETFGRDQLLTGMYRKPWSKLLAESPLSHAIQRDIARIYTEKRDYLAQFSPDEKVALLRKISYAEYLTKHCALVPEALVFFQSFPHDLFAVGIDGVSAWSCYHGVDDFGAFVYPGFDGLGLPPIEPSEPYIHHFPDGNASVARLLVRSLVPDAMAGNSMHDIVLAKVDYSRLDQARAAVRIRLNSTVVHVRQDPAEPAAPVQVIYGRGDKLKSVVAKHCVLACHNAMIPYLCPDLPQEQRKALSYLVRMPLVYTHVLLRNWRAFAKLGVRHIVAPGAYHNYVTLDFPVSLGDYQFPSRPEEPAVLFMLRVPCRPGLSRRDQNRVGRWELLNTSLAAYEEKVRDQLGRMLAGTGFDSDKDIAGITVNRWAHGYSFIPNRLFDPEWPDAEKPWVIGRQPWGNVSIANADAGASAYMDVAIDQASRAVDELLTRRAPT
ncbi:MAG TPA: FAD/NAD(P)-binding protein [Polyangiaceae bacterium]